MPTVVLTQKVASDRLGVSRHEVARRLVDGSLTPAVVDDRPAVLVDKQYEKVRRAVRKAVAA